MYMLQQTIGFMYDIYLSVFLNKFTGHGRAVPVGDLWVVIRGKILSLLLISRHSDAKKGPPRFFFFFFLCPYYKINRSF